MRIAVDALSISNYSGARVVLGHLSNLARAGRGRHSFHVFHGCGNRHLRRDLGDNVEWIECPGAGTTWPRRAAWQALRYGGALQEIGAGLLISTSGSLLPFVRIPQLVVAMNPWCFWPQFHASTSDRIKAFMQRHGYRRAQKRAAAVFCLSEYLASAYRENAGCQPPAGGVAYTGVDEGVFAAADASTGFDRRLPEVVCVSVMARHKSVEDLVAAFALVCQRGVKARLCLVGPWPEPSYRSDIERQVRAAGIEHDVQITGAVSDEELAMHYRRARVFCLLSRCESFGIPAVEAQLYGTPCVVADTCAPPEIAGPGGAIVPPGDIAAAAEALACLLVQREMWEEASARACVNVERFRWNRVSEPLIRFIDSYVGAA
jgi:glycosyltransferase involved in cell wall biosynthesis